VETGYDRTFVGCMTPIPTDFIATKLDTSIISQFVHKIGNHFQLINLMIGSLKKMGTNSQDIEALQQTIDKAVEFTRSFSHFSQAPVCTTAVNLRDIVASAIKSVTSVFAERNVLFQDLQGSSTLEAAYLSGDGFLLERALEAILHNALEATGDNDQILVSSGTEMETRTGREIARIVVTDNGAGIEAGIAASVADPFVTSKRDRDGLGLSTALRVIEAHSGTLKFTSEPGRGTKMEVVLPITHSSE
jgi:signal transduction histidine kinase